MRPASSSAASSASAASPRASAATSTSPSSPASTATATLAVGEEILRALNEFPFEREGIALRPGISVGAAAYPEGGGDLPSLFHSADEALYRAKQAGKNRVCR